MKPTCPLCWYQFPTQEELAQHVAMESSLTYEVEVTIPRRTLRRSAKRA